MRAPVIDHFVTVWLTHGVPTRMVLDGRRWIVTDTPYTSGRSGAVVLNVAEQCDGWRFQASRAGQSFVFDVFADAGGHWHVHRVYD
ncbi:hypothetical protein CJ226_17635 [Microbacterium sp. UMB0228]|nr:hypothetical protein CJ226_17635 [Microbacterium sp. UMB0228]